MRIRIVVASQADVTFYDTQDIGDKLEVTGRLTDPLAHLHDRDFKSDRPGRFSDHAPLVGGRRGATAGHGTGGERRPRKHEAIIFAQKIASELEQAHQADRFDRLIVMGSDHCFQSFSGAASSSAIVLRKREPVRPSVTR